DLNAVTLVRASWNDFAQKNDLLVPFPDRDIQIGYAFSFVGELGQLVIMRREKSARLDLVVQKFGHAPGDREPVEGRCSSSDFVENYQTPFGRVVHDVRGLIHLDHERRLAAG